MFLRRTRNIFNIKNYTDTSFACLLSIAIRLSDESWLYNATNGLKKKKIQLLVLRVNYNEKMSNAFTGELFNE